MTALVTDKFEQISAAPNGIPLLRELILKLAVQGRLTGSEFRANSAEHLQSGWRFLKLPDAATYRIGKTPPSKEARHWDAAGIPWVSISDMTHFETVTETARKVSKDFAGETFRYEPVPAGSLLMSFKLTVGKVSILGVAGYHNEAIISMQPKNGLSRDYLMRVLPAIAQSGRTKDALMGATLNSSSLAELIVPVPSIEEQHRIVAKVDELMALCDRLEAEQADAEAAHAKLVDALLASLTQSRDAADFRASWQQLAEHFHTLFTTEASIHALEKAVLRLGVMGKLVAHVTDGETAVQLLSRIADARKDQVNSGSVEKSLAPYSVPPDWCWTNLPAVGELARGKSKHRPRNDPTLYSGGTIPLVQTGDVARANGVINTSTGKYNAAGLAQSRLWPAGTMCITIAANIADSAVLGFDACFPDSVVGFIPGLPEINVKYFEYFLRTAKADLQKFAPSTAQKNINLDILGKLCVPLPPLAELNLIVAKVDELLTLCEQLRLRLSQVRHHHEHLAAVLVEQAVA